jgi:hypothetical protein
MTLSVGTKLGPYEIVGALGAGGMGEVYRARDPKLNRDVALKILPELFAMDPDRLARFKREAQVLASLNHPNIAAIYGFEDSNSVQALVLELVEGSGRPTRRRSDSTGCKQRDRGSGRSRSVVRDARGRLDGRPEGPAVSCLSRWPEVPDEYSCRRGHHLTDHGDFELEAQAVAQPSTLVFA